MHNISDCDTRNEKLHLLGYDPLWLGWGFIDVDLLTRQYDEFLIERTGAIEHYRYAAFRQWIERQGAFTDNQIVQFVELVRLDADPMMAHASVVDLLRHPKISLPQFELLAFYLCSLSDHKLCEVVQRERYLREIRQKNSLTFEEFEYYMAFEDTLVHMYILENFASGYGEFLSILSQRGKTKAIRNIAKQQLSHLKRKLQQR